MYADGLLLRGRRRAAHVLLAHGLQRKGQAQGSVSWLAQLVVLHLHDVSSASWRDKNLGLCIAGARLQHQAPVSTQTGPAFSCGDTFCSHACWSGLGSG